VYKKKEIIEKPEENIRSLIKTEKNQTSNKI